MGTFLIVTFLFMCVGAHYLKKAGPKMLRFAVENRETCRSGGMMLKRMFGR
jgi:hypothetical protein